MAGISSLTISIRSLWYLQIEYLWGYIWFIECWWVDGYVSLRLSKLVMTLLFWLNTFYRLSQQLLLGFEWYLARIISTKTVVKKNVCFKSDPFSLSYGSLKKIYIMASMNLSSIFLRFQIDQITVSRLNLGLFITFTDMLSYFSRIPLYAM